MSLRRLSHAEPRKMRASSHVSRYLVKENNKSLQLWAYKSDGISAQCARATVATMVLLLGLVALQYC
jgi:hypothetical protein